MIQALPIDPPGLDAAQAAEFAAMQKLLTLSAGEFSLSSVICNDVALERMLIQALLSSRPGLIHVALAADARDAFELARSRPGATRATGLLVSGFADWLGDENNRTQRIRTLNASRELWQRSFPCPVLFWMNTTVAPRLAYEAPDLWRYRSHRFDLTIAAPDAGSRGMLAAQYADGGDSLSLPRERKLERIAELRQRLAEITDAAPPQMRQHAVRWMIELGNLQAIMGNVRDAMEHFEEALAIAHEIGNRRGESYALNNLGNAHADLGDARKAIEFYEQHRTIAREIGDRHGEGNALGNLGLAHAAVGEARKAIEFYEQALAIAREVGNRRAEGSVLGNLGNAHADFGDVRKAIEFHEQHLAIAREIGDRRGEANALGSLGNAHVDLGDARKAIEFYEQALLICRQIGDRRGESADLGNIGNAHYVLDDTRKAIEFYEQALFIRRQIGDRQGEAIDSWNLGLRLVEQEEVERGMALLQVWVDYLRELGHPEAEKAAATVEGLRRGDASS